MPSIDESIRKIDNVICRHLDEIENNSRGAISQDILLLNGKIALNLWYLFLF